MGLRGAARLAVLLLCACLAHALVGNAPAKRASACTFVYKQQRTVYTYRLAGLTSQAGYYTITLPLGNAQGPFTTYWWQFCANMNFKGTPSGQRPSAVCGARGPRSQCPQGCIHPSSRICGNGCSGLMAQQLPPNQAACWNLGQWAGGKLVSISLYNPSDPTQGVVYTMRGGDNKGCVGKNTKRSLSVAIQCPTSRATIGLPPLPVNVTYLGNCAYAATMSHPAACPTYNAGRKPTGVSSIQRLRGTKNPQNQAWYKPEQRSWFNSFMVLSLSCFALYIVAGVAFRYKTLGLRGLDTIPHLDFWRSLPSRARRMYYSATHGSFGSSDIYSRYGYGPGAATDADERGSLLSAGAGSSLHVEVPRGGGGQF